MQRITPTRSASFPLPGRRMQRAYNALPGPFASIATRSHIVVMLYRDRARSLALLALLPLLCFASSAFASYAYQHIHPVSPAGAASLADVRAALYMLSIGFLGYGILALFPLAIELYSARVTKR